MSKGGTTSGSTEIPAWLENAAIENINKARDVSEIGYTPYYGPDVAAFSPMQQQSMQSTGNAASAFGLAPQGFDAMAGMPQAQTFAGGVQGYSSAPLYEQSLGQLEANRPAQYNAMSNMFIDPFTGARPQGDYAASPEQVSQMFSNPNDNGGGGGGEMFGGNLVEWGNDANMDHLRRAPDFTPAADGGTGYWSGGERTATQTNDMTDPEFESYVLAHGLPQADQYTTRDALGGIVGNVADSTLIGRMYEGVTGNPLGGGSFNAPISGLDSSDVSGGRFNGMVGYEDYNPNITPYVSIGITPEIGGGLLRGTPLDNLNNEYDLQTALRDEELAQELAKKVAIDTRAKREAANRAAAAKKAAAKKAADKKAAAAKSTVNSGGDGRGARQRDRNSGGGGYGGGGDSYDPSGRF